MEKAMADVRGELDEPWDFDGSDCGIQRFRVELSQTELPRLFGRDVV
jgi:hypothetical protein